MKRQVPALSYHDYLTPLSQERHIRAKQSSGFASSNIIENKTNNKFTVFSTNVTKMYCKLYKTKQSYFPRTVLD